MTARDFDALISELRSAIAANDYARLVTLLASAPDERADDVAAICPHARGVWSITEAIEGGDLHDAADELERHCGAYILKGNRIPEGFAPVLGDMLHKAMLAAREEDEWDAVLALDAPAGDQVMVVSDDERRFSGEEDEDGIWEDGLAELWPDLHAVIYDGEALDGRGEARAYVSGDMADLSGLPGQQVAPVTHPVIDSDGITRVYVLPTLSGWKVWTR